MRTKFSILLFLAAITMDSARAVPIVNWTFETPATAASPSAAGIVPNVTASSFKLKPSGVLSFVSGGASPSPTTAVSASGWAGAAGSKWWEFTVTASVGYEMDLSSLAFDDLRSASGPTTWSVEVNGVAAALSQLTHATFSANTVALSASAFQNLSSATVKIFGFGAPSAGGTWRLDNVALNGTVTRIPDNGKTAILLSIPLLGLFAMRRFAT